MDSYFQNRTQPGPTDEHPPGDDGGVGALCAHGSDLACEDEIARQSPPAGVGQNERRMHVRAYNHWASLLGDRPCPRLQDLSGKRVPGFADHAVLLDYTDGVANPAVSMLGERLAAECDATMAARLSDVSDRCLLSRISDHCQRVLANQAPIGFEAEFVNQRGKTLLYRGILLPFASNGPAIEHILGVINWKELADPVATAELHNELEMASRSAPAGSPGPGLTAWADGPAAHEPGEPAGADPHLFDPVERELAEHLAGARSSVEVACALRDQSRAALHAAIGRAWDFALAAQLHPGVLHKMLGQAGVVAKPSTSMTAIVGLVFGKAHDRPPLAQLATVLAHARRHGLNAGQLASLLAETTGGLDGVVRKERELRRREKAAQGKI